MSDSSTLPSEIAACHALIQSQNKVNEDLARELEKAKSELEQLKRFIYGRRSERHVEDGSQLTFLDQEQAAAAEDQEPAEVVEQEITYRRRKRTKADRFPANLAREVQTFDVPPEQQACACCGEAMPIIDTDIRERLEFIPAKLVVHEMHYPKRACSKCKQGVSVAPPAGL